MKKLFYLLFTLSMLYMVANAGAQQYIGAPGTTVYVRGPLFSETFKVITTNDPRVSTFNGATGAVTGVASFNGSTGAVTGVATFNGATGAVTGVASFNGSTGAVTGVASFNGSTGAVTGVATFNGATGAVTGVASVNGSTGAVTNVLTSGGNNFGGTISVGSSSAQQVNIVYNGSTKASATNAGMVIPILQITGGTPGSGKVLTSDASGNASWQTAASGGPWTMVTGTGSTNGSSATTYTLPSMTTGQVMRVRSNYVAINTGSNRSASGEIFSTIMYNGVSYQLIGTQNSIPISTTLAGSSAIAVNTAGATPTIDVNSSAPSGSCAWTVYISYVIN